MKLVAVVVDDEPLARDRMQRLLSAIDAVSLIAVGEDGQQAVELCNKHKPDILFLDINMPVKNGIQAALEIVNDNSKPPAIIFCTAHDEFAIEAFQASADAYLLKPVTSDDLVHAISQASRLSKAQLNTLIEHADTEKTISIKRDGVIEKRPVSQILYFRADDKLLVAGVSEGKEIVVDFTLKKLEQELSDSFLRVHRNTLVRKGSIERFWKDSDNKAWVKLNGCERPFSVSRRHLSQVKAHFA